MVNFYHRFISAAARLMAPLNRALTGTNQLLKWTEEMLTAFSKTKEALANATRP